MKEQYENRTRYLLPRRTYTVIRCDGKAFHTITRDLDKPYDERLIMRMDNAALTLCREAQGACLGYVQSDEISVLLQDFADIKTDAWFDGNIQKICSVAGSIVTAHFNYPGCWYAKFDARVFTIPDPVEVENYFIWRQQDASRNSLQMLARTLYSHNELEGKGTEAIHEMLHQKGVNWNDLPPFQKRGRGIVYNQDEGWSVDQALPVWTQERGWLRSRIPLLPTFTPETP